MVFENGEGGAETTMVREITRRAEARVGENEGRRGVCGEKGDGGKDKVFTYVCVHTRGRARGHVKKTRMIGEEGDVELVLLLLVDVCV